MTSSRLILIFLGIIFLIIIILSSGKIAGALRERFAAFIPNLKPAEELTPTPTVEMETPTPFVTHASPRPSSSQSGEIPATGPNDIVWLLLGTGLITGISLKKLSSKSW